MNAPQQGSNAPQRPMNASQRRAERATAGRLALGVGLAVFATKLAAYLLTDSSAIFSDAMESVVNVVAAGLLLYSLTVAARPPDPDHPYGHGKVEFFSAGVEGTLIAIAAGLILVEAVGELLRGPELRRLDSGLALLVAAGAVNAGLGVYLLRAGRRTGSLALTADGRHVLADVWTSAGVIVGLVAVRMTGWSWLDPLVAIAVALHVLRTGYSLVREAVGGLMDEAPEPLLEAVVAGLAAGRESAWIDAHGLRAWRSGDFIHVDLHLGVPRYFDADALHEIDERVGAIVARAVASPNETIVHFDPCRPRQCPSCRVPGCSIRKAPFARATPFTLASVTRRDEALETGEPLSPDGALAFVSLGSNLGDRAAHLRDAARSLAATPGVTLLARSRVYETDPVGPPPQGPYLNAVLKLRTTLSAADLLARLLSIERQHGRERGAERNLARSLDLDLLDYDGRVLVLDGDPALELPHPRLHERGFVLEPLAELAGDRRHPESGVPYATLAARVRDAAAVRLQDESKGGAPWPSSP